MKKVVLLSSFLVLFWTSSGAAAAQSLSGLTGPLKDVVDEVKKPVDKIKEPIEKALPPDNNPVKKPVEDVTKEVGKVVDTVVKDVTDVAKNVTDVAKNPPVSSGGGGDKPDPVPSVGSIPDSGPSELDRSTTGATATKTEAARTSRGSRKATRGANRAEPVRDTDQVAAAGNTIEPAEVKDTQIVAPATDVEESEGSGLSLSGAQILTWLMLACGLLGAGTAFVVTGRMRARTVSS